MKKYIIDLRKKDTSNNSWQPKTMFKYLLALYCICVENNCKPPFSKCDIYNKKINDIFGFQYKDFVQALKDVSIIVNKTSFYKHEGFNGANKNEVYQYALSPEHYKDILEITINNFDRCIRLYEEVVIKYKDILQNYLPEYILSDKVKYPLFPDLSRFASKYEYKSKFQKNTQKIANYIANSYPVKNEDNYKLIQICTQLLSDGYQSTHLTKIVNRFPKLVNNSRKLSQTCLTNNTSNNNNNNNNKLNNNSNNKLNINNNSLISLYLCEVGKIEDIVAIMEDYFVWGNGNKKEESDENSESSDFLEEKIDILELSNMKCPEERINTIFINTQKDGKRPLYDLLFEQINKHNIENLDTFNINVNYNISKENEDYIRTNYAYLLSRTNIVKCMAKEKALLDKYNHNFQLKINVKVYPTKEIDGTEKRKAAKKQGIEYTKNSEECQSYKVVTSIRQWNPDAGIPKVLRNNLFSLLGYDGNFDLHSAVFATARLINTGLFDSDWDVKSEFIKDYGDKFYLIDGTPIDRNVIKKLSMRMFFKTSDGQSLKDYKNTIKNEKLHSDKFSKDELTPEMDDDTFLAISEIISNYIGGSEKLTRNIFAIESLIEIKTLRKLYSKGFDVKNVYDCFFFKTNELTEDYVKKVVEESANETYKELVGNIDTNIKIKLWRTKRNKKK